GLRVSVHHYVRGARVVGGGRVAGLSGPSPRAWGSVRTPFVTSDWMAVHPHVRGARSHHEIGDEEWDGPSPRAWGSGTTYQRAVQADRSIPTCVGLGKPRERTAQPGPVHPHVRGARGVGDVLSQEHSGPSPRAWGSGWGQALGRKNDRSIPTCVGLGCRAIRAVRGRPVHPHVRGARREPFRELLGVDGPSPRAWGSAWGRGKRGPRVTVHPHVRGARRCRGCGWS